MKRCQECFAVLCECGNCHNFDECSIASDCLNEMDWSLIDNEAAPEEAAEEELKDFLNKNHIAVSKKAFDILRGK